MNIPQHVAFIMDGSRRWARQHNVSFKEGHSRAIDRLNIVMKHAFNRGVSYVTAYALSSENLQRPEEELRDLFDLIVEYAQRYGEELLQNGVRVRVVGNMALLPTRVKDSLVKLENSTEENNRYVLILAINYGSHLEITDAAYAMAKQVLDRGKMPDFLTFYKDFSSNFNNFPYPDLLIRTSEQRLSNFMLWQLAYTEIYFNKTLWPDFMVDDFDNILEQFSLTQRRYGL